MNLGEIRAEVKARGFDDIADARIDRWINQAVREINDAENWWWLDSVATGAAPLAITDLRTVLSVQDTAQDSKGLEWRDLRDIVGDYGSATTTGTPRFYYVTSTGVSTYPVGGTLRVSYLSTGANLSADADVPTIPVAYHDLIVNGAVRKGYLDSDEFEAANMMRQEVAIGLEQMRASQLDRQDDGNDRIILVDTWL